MGGWWSIEVFHREFQAASRWKDSYSAALVEAAYSNGADEWAWAEHRSGVVFEVRFEDDARWERFRDLPGVQAALDGVPDPVGGLLVYRGRGGTAGGALPLRPRPMPGAGAMSLPSPGGEPGIDLTSTAPPGLADAASLASG